MFVWSACCNTSLTRQNIKYNHCPQIRRTLLICETPCRPLRLLRTVSINLQALAWDCWSLTFLPWDPDLQGPSSATDHSPDLLAFGVLISESTDCWLYFMSSGPSFQNHPSMHFKAHSSGYRPNFFYYLNSVNGWRTLEHAAVAVNNFHLEL